MEYTLTPISPLHISSKEQLNETEFFINNDKLYVVDLEDIFRDNREKQIELFDIIQKKGNSFVLDRFLTEKEKETISSKYSISLDPSTVKVIRDDIKNGKFLGIEKFIKNPSNYKVYIPGSAIKGAFRTAILYTTFKKNINLRKRLINILKVIPKSSDIDFFMDNLIFYGGNSDPKYDILKTFLISDSLGYEPNSTIKIDKIKVLSLTGKEENGIYVKPLWNIMETASVNSSFKGKVDINKNLILSEKAFRILGWKDRHKRFDNIQEYIYCANYFSYDLCEYEIKFYKEIKSKYVILQPIIDFYENLKFLIKRKEKDTCYLSIGTGSGWHKMTIGMLLSSEDEIDFKKIRLTFGLGDKRLGFPFPKTRRLAMHSNNEPISPLGWIKIKFS